eukprot:Gb_35480 [translate_table: standard]
MHAPSSRPQSKVANSNFDRQSTSHIPIRDSLSQAHVPLPRDVKVISNDSKEEEYHFADSQLVPTIVEVVVSVNAQRVLEAQRNVILDDDECHASLQADREKVEVRHFEEKATREVALAKERHLQGGRSNHRRREKAGEMNRRSCVPREG